MKVEELASTMVQAPPPPTFSEEFEETDDDQMLIDMRSGMSLLRSTKTLLDFFSDITLKKTLNQHDRATMQKLSENIREFLVEAVATYEEFE